MMGLSERSDWCGSKVDIWALKLELGLPELTESTCNKVDVVMTHNGTRGVLEALWWMWLSSWKGPKRRERLSTNQTYLLEHPSYQNKIELTKVENVEMQQSFNEVDWCLDNTRKMRVSRRNRDGMLGEIVNSVFSELTPEDRTTMTSGGSVHIRN